MLAVMAPPDSLSEFADDDVCLAAVNAPQLSVLSGPHEAVARVAEALVARNIAVHRLHTSHAFHSSMMDPMLEQFEALVDRVPLGLPALPYVSTLTGRWADADVTKPDYWSSQIRSTVRFADALQTLCDSEGPLGADPVLLEVGPGRALLSAARSTDSVTGARLLATLPAAEDDSTGTEQITASLGKLWECGIEVDWTGYHANERGRRVSLPTYPFERKSYWIGRPNVPGGGTDGPRDVGGWFSAPVWREADVPQTDGEVLNGTAVLVVDEGTGVGEAVASAVRAVGAVPVVVQRGDRFERVGETGYRLDPTNAAEFSVLVADACGRHRISGVVHCWGAQPPGDTDVADAALTTFLTPLRLAVALGSQSTARPLPFVLVARGVADVAITDSLDPSRAFGIGAVKVLPQELTGLRMSHVDIDGDETAPSIVTELAAGATESEVAYRAGTRYVRAYEPVEISEARPPSSMPAEPVILVTGGVGYMGSILAEPAFDSLGAKLVLVARSALPPPDEWAAASADPARTEAERTVLRRLAVMRAKRDDILVVHGDLDDAEQVRAAVDSAIARFGGVDVVIHGAANVSPAAFGAVERNGRRCRLGADHSEAART